MGPKITGCNTCEHFTTLILDLFEAFLKDSWIPCLQKTLKSFPLMCATEKQKENAALYMKGVLQKKWNYTDYKNKTKKNHKNKSVWLFRSHD